MIIRAILVCRYWGGDDEYDRVIYLDFGEFLIAISITAQQEPKRKLEWAFTMYGMYLIRLFEDYFTMHLCS